MAETTTIKATAGQTIARELMIAYLNTGTTEKKSWSAFGKRVSSSNMSYDWGKTTEKDILGNTYSGLKKPTITQSFDPLPLTSDDAAVVRLWELAIRDQDNHALAGQEVMVAHFYAGDPSKNFAEVYSSSAIVVSRNGGDGGDNLTLAAEVTYGGERTLGTVSKSTSGEVTFAPDSAA